MPVDLTNLNKSIEDLTTQVSQTVGAEDSAEALIAGFAAAIKTAVAAALTADAAANEASISAANDAIAKVTAQFSASSAKLGQAVADNPLPTA